MMSLVTTKGLVEVISSYIHGFKLSNSFKQDKPLIQTLLGVTTETILEFKDRELYDNFSM